MFHESLISKNVIMKRLLIIYVVSLLTSILFYGCNNGNEIEPLPDISCQTIVKSTIIDNQLVYKVEKIVSTSEPMRTVYEVGPEGTFDLSNEVVYQDYNYEIRKITTYSGKIPPEGTYIFNVTFPDGLEKSVYSSTNKPFLLPPEIVSASIDRELITVKWNKVENAEYYQIFTVLNGNRNIYIKKTNTCEAEINAYDFTINGSFDLCIEVKAVNTKGNTEKVSSEGIAQTDVHIDELPVYR
jgi:hypothetical protein